MSLNKSKRFIFFALLAMFLFYARGSWAEGFNYDSTGLRNPFVPIVSPEGRLLKVSTGALSGDLILEGIIYDPKGDSYAIINATVVRPQDNVNGWDVVKIEQNKVIVSKGTQFRELEIRTSE